MINVDLFYVLIYHPHNLFDGVPAQIFAYFYWVISPLFNFESFIYIYIYIYIYVYICMYVCMYVCILDTSSVSDTCFSDMLSLGRGFIFHSLHSDLQRQSFSKSINFLFYASCFWFFI